MHTKLNCSLTTYSIKDCIYSGKLCSDKHHGEVDDTYHMQKQPKLLFAQLQGAGCCKILSFHPNKFFLKLIQLPLCLSTRWLSRYQSSDGLTLFFVLPLNLCLFKLYLQHFYVFLCLPKSSHPLCRRRHSFVKWNPRHLCSVASMTTAKLRCTLFPSLQNRTV